MSTINLQVQGMTCSACVRHVSQALTAVTGVKAVQVDLDSGRVLVDGSPDGTSLLAALDAAGYEGHLASQAPSLTTAATAKQGCGSGCGCR
ncbi:heavy-metal-associated domain-containing protein [Stutzerimonas stutzeri]|jgi:copper chaperone|uniref:heavy-metal-associated domain-containing protein n=1 Tax=Stutzerimonas stutzeri TaxID=316 RepID=UPI002109FBD7|nr:heavy metal-associated domain-containing protein [Stutzerimonas stutzeri]MCQ4256791.1 heavy-metal-associated domain-containing protein [Stutzerimonas stutzeri]